jgi:PEP-CTERM motif
MNERHGSVFAASISLGTTMMKLPRLATESLLALALLLTLSLVQSAAAQEFLTLNVDRGTGLVSISNPGTNTAPISLNGYSILSSLGALKPANGQWNSLDDQDFGGANVWLEAAPTVTDLSELNPLSSSTINVGASLPNMGSAYQQIIPAFGQNPDHLVFEYNVPSVTTTQVGTVTYSGTKVNNNLIVTVNTTTGAVQLKNDSPYDIFIDGYAVYSTSGSLQVANGTWLSLQDQAVPGWEEATPSVTAASELRQNGFTRLTGGSGFNLGTLYNAAGGTPDLTFQFFQQGSLNPTDGVVAYGAFGAVSATSAGVLADFNNNGVVDTADYVVWRAAQGTRTLLRNDPIGGQIGTLQYNLWRANFGNSTAGGAGTSLASVPEPGSMLLLLIAGLALAWHRSAGRQRVIN